MRTPFALLLACAALTLGACGGSDDSQSASTPASTPSTPATTPAATSPPASDADAGDAKDGVCQNVAEPKPKSPNTPKPTGALDPAKSYTVVMKTSCGEIRIKLDQVAHPKTANAFATLVRNNYFDGLGFHRVVQGFVIQGGDPLGNGSGGPPWQVVEAPGAGAKYTRGVVAMAKTGSDPAGAVGSQFFIVSGADVGLPPEYAIAGKVKTGRKVVDAISALGTGGDGPPTRPIIIRKAYLDVQ